MFEQLKRAFSDVAKNISSHKIISEKDLNKGLSELELSLLESDVAPEVVDELSKSLRTELLGLELEKDQTSEQVIKLKLRHLIRDMFTKSGSMNLIQQIKIKKEAGYGPFVIVLLGINGTGKTTTIAKIARLLKKNGISVVLAAADTHRAGAIEQLSQHGENLSIKVISQRYGADPSAVGRDAVEYATKHRVDTVLIDTAGRMQTAKNLMDEINKIVRVVKPDIKLFIGDSLAGNDTINQSREFFEYTKFDGAILTKTDADVKGGSAISIVHTTSKPIVLLGMGQSYDDIVPFNSEKFLDSIFGDSPLISEKEIPAPVTTKIDQTDVYERSRQMAQKEIQPDLLREGQSMELSADSSDIKTSNVESLGEGNAEELSPQQAPEQQQQQQQQQAPEQQQQQMEQLKKTITTSPNINPREPNGKKESGGFFKTLFGRKSKNSGQDLERKHDVKENPEVDKKAEIELASSKEPEEYIDKKIKTDKKIKNQENDEVVYLSDEDIEDLLK